MEPGEDNSGQWREQGGILVPAGLVEDGEPPVEPLKDAEALLKSINDTAGNARNLFVTYIVLAVYVLLTVGSTNDEQLFRDSSIAVPFLSNINLPVTRFYQYAPWMFLFVHMDQLLLFKLLADKLHAFNSLLQILETGGEDGDKLRRQLSILPFAHWLAGDRKDGFSHYIIGLVVWSTLLVLPILTLLGLLIAFLPYHGAITTFAHKATLVLDALALLWFWPRLAAGMPRQTWHWWLPFGAGKPAACRGVCRTASVAILLGSVYFGGFVAVLPGERLEDDGTLTHWLFDEAFSNKTIKPHLPLFHRNLDLHKQPLIANMEVILAELLKPNLQSEQLQSLLMKNKGLDLQNRDLRFANLTAAKLRKADLRQANLQDANLSQASLQDANLSQARLQGASLADASLQGVNLTWANLQGAELRYAKLQGAELSYAKLQGANLRQANLQGVNLMQAQLEGARLNSAKIGSASFESADFKFNDMRGVDKTPIDQKDFEFWKTHLLEEKLDRQKKWLKDRVGKPAIFPEQGISQPCLADTLPTENFEHCQAANPEFFQALADYLGKLACSDYEKREGQNFIAEGIARQTAYFDEWDDEGKAAQRKLAQRLLQEDCAGKSGLDVDVKAGLRRLAEAPEPKPSVPPQPGRP